MKNLPDLVRRSQQGDLQAYDQIVRTLQDTSVSYAYSILYDYHLAEDATQEAFIRAFLEIACLRDPVAFPGWLRQIIRARCSRIARRLGSNRRGLETLSPSTAQSTPEEDLERRERTQRLQKAIEALPENQRAVVMLYYMADCSQQEVADFLQLPVTTVNFRLHSARTRLREEFDAMTQDASNQNRPSQNASFATEIMDELVGLADSEIQDIMRKSNFEETAAALRGASRAVRERFLGNMSRRVRKLMEDEINAREVDSQKEKAAQERLVRARKN